MKIYLSGPITGHPDAESVFAASAFFLRQMGHEVSNPCEINPPDTPHAVAMRRDLLALLACETMVLLPGWEASRGARLEVAVARAVGIAVVFHVPAPAAPSLAGDAGGG